MTQTIKTKSILKITNQNGRSFNLLVIEAGDQYGRDNCLTHEEGKEPTVEFYDATYQGKNEDWLFGQFVSRYYITTLLATYNRPGYPNGLCLDGGVAAWNVDAPAMAVALDWLEKKTGFWQFELKATAEVMTTTIAGDA